MVTDGRTGNYVSRSRLPAIEAEIAPHAPNRHNFGRAKLHEGFFPSVRMRKCVLLVSAPTALTGWLCVCSPHLYVLWRQCTRLSMYTRPGAVDSPYIGGVEHTRLQSH